MKQKIINRFQGRYGKFVLFHHKFPILLCSLSFLVLSSYFPSSLHGSEEFSEKKPDLTLSNFFSEGWKFTQWDEPEQEPDQAPRFRLLKIPATVFEREIRMNYSFTNNGDRGEVDEHEWEFEIEIPVSRRLLLEVEPTIVSISPRDNGSHSGFGDTSLIARIMFMETRNTTVLSILDLKLPIGYRIGG